MIIKEQNNWKLIKKEDAYYLVCPSGEEVKLNVTSEGNLNNCFNHAVTYNWTWLKRTYYTVSLIKSKVAVGKNEKSIRSDSVDKFERSYYLTEAQAKQAINDVLPRAEQHFKTCLENYRKLANDLNFYVGFNYDGDTHGIYNEYEYISFKMDGFSFQFEID